MVKNSMKVHQLVLNIQNRRIIVKLYNKENALINQYFNRNYRL